MYQIGDTEKRDLILKDIQRVSPVKREIPEIVIYLMTALRRHDAVTYMHSLRVARLSWELSNILGCEFELSWRIFLAGLLHDIGKMFVPQTFLRKEGRLTAYELTIVQRHVENGVHLARHYAELWSLVPMIATHHERPDGLGYPKGLKGQDIPLGGLIIGVTDSLDAMVTSRPYRTGLPMERVMNELFAGAGRQWDYASALIAVHAFLAADVPHPQALTIADVHSLLGRGIDKGTLHVLC